LPVSNLKYKCKTGNTTSIVKFLGNTTSHNTSIEFIII